MVTRSAPSFRSTFAITAGALFMFVLDRQVVATALVSIRRDLHASVQTLQWTVSAYTLSFSVLLLAGAALGDRLGRRQMLTVGVAIFTAGSAGCALAPSATVLIAARVVQGVGGALLAPLSLTLLVGATPPASRGRVLGLWGAVATVAGSLGPIVGGALTETLSWHWIFWLNVPLGVALIALARRHLTESFGSRRPLDLVGLGLSALALLALVWALIEAGQRGWGSDPVRLVLGAGAALLGAFVTWERRTSAPMVPLELFGSRAFCAAAAASLLSYFGFFGGFFLVAQLLQIGIGAPPFSAGVEMLTLTVTAFLTAPRAGALCDRYGPRLILAGSAALEAAALAWFALAAAPGITYLDVAPGLACAGVAGAGLFAPIQSTMLSAAPPEHHGPASGLANAIREFGGVLGVAVIGTVFAAHGGTGSAVAFLAGFRPALLCGAAVAAAGALCALCLPGAPRGTPELHPVPAD